MTNWVSQQLKTMRDKFWSGGERETTQNAFHDLGINPILVDQILCILMSGLKYTILT